MLLYGHLFPCQDFVAVQMFIDKAIQTLWREDIFYGNLYLRYAIENTIDVLFDVSFSQAW